MDMKPIIIKPRAGFSGKKHSEETRKKIGDSKRGKPNVVLRKLSGEQRDQVRQRLNNGESASVLALHFGVSRSTIYRCQY